MKLLQFKKSPYFHTGLYLEYSPTFLTPTTKCEGYGTHRTDWVHDKNVYVETREQNYFKTYHIQN